MKREAPSCTKMKRLCKRLGLRQYMGIGLLESLWHLTAREAPHGDIGKLDDEDIALYLDFEGRPEDLIEALVDAKWLDRCSCHRLTVHDWHEHADDATKKKVERSKRPFLSRHVSTSAEHICLPVPEPVPEPEPVPVPGPAPTPKPEPSAAPAVRTPPAHLASSLLKIEFTTNFWPICWLKVGRGDAEKAYIKQRKAGHSSELICAAAVAQGPAIIEAASLRGSSILHSATWLNQGRFLDEGWADDVPKPAPHINGKSPPTAKERGLADLKKRLEIA
jgi:hypothetical protein